MCYLGDVYNSDTCENNDIMKALDRKYPDREEMIAIVRSEAKKAGFNICIPRGDTLLNDGTKQVTLY